MHTPDTQNDRIGGNIRKNTRAQLQVKSLNVKGRGANSAYAPQSKWSQINQHMRSSRVGILAVQETHMTAEFADALAKIYGKTLHIIHSYDANRPNAQGVAIVINKERTNYKGTTYHNLIPGRALLVKIPWHRNKTVTILNIYAPNDGRENARFWADLEERWAGDSTLPRPDIMLGDLNLVEEAIDRYPNHRDNEDATTALRSLRNALELSDGWRTANPESAEFTFPKRNEGSLSRIDRIYVTPETAKACDKWRIDRLCPIETDHHATTVNLTDPQMPYIGSGRWTLPLALLQDEKFIAQLDKLAKELANSMERVTRARTEVENPQALLAHFKNAAKSAAKARAREKMPMLKRTLEKLEKGLNAKLRPTNGKITQMDQQHAARLQAQINKIQSKQLLNKRLYARATHEIEGDTTTKYWIGMTKDRKPRDVMYSIFDPIDPTRNAKRSDEMADLAKTYHDRIQKNDYREMDEDRTASTQSILKEVDARHPQSDPGNLNKSISTEDTREALGRSANGKAAGMDGVPYELWKLLQKRGEDHRRRNTAYPDIVGILTEVFNDVEVNGVDPKAQFSIGWMCPIYKKGDRNNIANYRPITLLNTDYKIMTKALAMKLAEAVPNLIHKNQAGFIPGRSIFDQTQLARLMIEYAEATEENGVIIALDQEKAYDRIDHEYIWLTLQNFGVPEHFIQTVKNLYQDAETSVVINGVISPPFRVTRGVRQGDPMSCLIFDLAIEPLACLLRKSDLQGFHIEGERERLITTLFADDTTVYLSEHDEYAELEQILDRWCNASLAKFNLGKTQLLPIGTEEYRTEYLVSGAPPSQRDKTVAQGQAIRLLGAWIGNGADQIAIWSPRIEKTQKDLNRWKACHPSLAGKALIVQMVIGGGTQYLTKVQGMPQEIERCFIKMITSFVWGEGKRADVNYDTLCLRPEQGGIGLLDIRARNKAIDLSWIRQYADLSPKRPTWGAVADILIGRAITRDSGKVHSLARFHTFLQTWRADTRPAGGLPAPIRSILKSAKEMSVTFAAIKPTRRLKKGLPIWYHLGASKDMKRLNNHYYSDCLRDTHQVLTVADAIRVTKRMRTRTTPPHKNRKDCRCKACREDRAKGCKKPHACCKLAGNLLLTLSELWDPLQKTPHDGLSLSKEDKDSNIKRREEGEAFTFDPSMSSANDLSTAFRAFHDIAAPAKYPPRRTGRQGLTALREARHAYVQSATFREGTRDANASAAVLFSNGETRGKTIPSHLPQTSLGADAGAIILAVTAAPTDAPLHIHTTSKALTESLNKKLQQHEDSGWTGVRDMIILRNAAYRLRHRAAPTIWHLEKREVNRGEYDTAKHEATRALRGEEVMEMDLSIPPQYNNSGIKLDTVTQKLAYRKIRELRITHPRQRTTRNLYDVLKAMDRICDVRPTDNRIWTSIRAKPIPRQIADFIWKAMHGTIKCGPFWKHIPGYEQRATCQGCEREESVEHILLECDRRGQGRAWALARALWERTGHTWPHLDIGALLGVGTLDLPNASPGKQRLLKIIIAETMWLVWRMRCERVIGHEDDSTWQHTTEEIENRWLNAINTRMTTDRIRTNTARFKSKASTREEVRDTWKSVSNMAAATDEKWFKEHGVLVGRGTGDPG